MMTQPTEQRTSDERSGVKTILLVEDDETIGEVLVEAISQETSYLVILVTDGLEALKVAESIRPNLFVLDYQLPQMDGIELYDRLHAMKELADVPTLMLSARLPQNELRNRQIVGMSKPVDMDEFLQKIDELLADS